MRSGGCERRRKEVRGIKCKEMEGKRVLCIAKEQWGRKTMYIKKLPVLGFCTRRWRECESKFELNKCSIRKSEVVGSSTMLEVMDIWKRARGWGQWEEEREVTHGMARVRVYNSTSRWEVVFWERPWDHHRSWSSVWVQGKWHRGWTKAVGCLCKGKCG